MIHHTMTLSILSSSLMFWSFQKILQAFPRLASKEVMYHELHQTVNIASSDVKGFPLSNAAERFLSH